MFLLNDPMELGIMGWCKYFSMFGGPLNKQEPNKNWSKSLKTTHDPPKKQLLLNKLFLSSTKTRIFGWFCIAARNLPSSEFGWFPCFPWRKRPERLGRFRRITMATRIDLPKGTKCWSFGAQLEEEVSEKPFKKLVCVCFSFPGEGVKFKDHPEFGWIKAMVFD